MATFCVENTKSGLIIGFYQGETPAQALDAMARDAGYDDYSHCCDVAQVAEGEIRVTEVDG